MSKDYKNAKGIFPLQPGDEPSEVTIRRLRDGNTPQWIFVEQWLPRERNVVHRVTNGYKMFWAYCNKHGKWVQFANECVDVIAWLYEPPMETPEPPTIEEHAQWLKGREEQS